MLNYSDNTISRSTNKITENDTGILKLLHNWLYNHFKYIVSHRSIFNASAGVGQNNFLIKVLKKYNIERQTEKDKDRVTNWKNKNNF